RSHVIFLFKNIFISIPNRYVFLLYKFINKIIAKIINIVVKVKLINYNNLKTMILKNINNVNCKTQSI
ncbi:MAG TPA: hypothetical protein DDY58_03355, partial [Terrisporobacter glycolicus]|uniref:hypothetical protein n=1 Tax=Terrisporobacter hibernicus TaxID=2813371 RepID=UPI000E8E8C86